MSAASASPSHPYRRRPKLVSLERARQTSIDLLDREGPSGLSMRKLAAELSVSLPTIYATIDSRERLVEEILVHSGTDLVAQVGAQVGVDAQLRALLSGLARRSWFLSLVSELDLGRRRLMWAKVAAASDCIDHVVATIRDGVGRVEPIDPVEALEVIVATAEFAVRLVGSGWGDPSHISVVHARLLRSVLVSDALELAS